MSLFGFSIGPGTTFVHLNHDGIHVVSLAPGKQSCYKKLSSSVYSTFYANPGASLLIFASVPSGIVLCSDAGSVEKTRAAFEPEIVEDSRIICGIIVRLLNS